jgi:hypothetical protein
MSNYKICSSYPEQVIVPKGIGDDYLRISATFRAGGRFPVLSYYHHKTKVYTHKYFYFKYIFGNLVNYLSFRPAINWSNKSTV